MPRRALTALSASSLPSGSSPASCSRRPIRVDLPWSTWPTMTIRTSARAPSGEAERNSEDMCTFMTIYAGGSVGGGERSQISGFAQALEGVLGFVIHGAARAFRDLRGVELGEDLVDGGGIRFDREGDVGIAERAI